jgi:thioesterase domain-containing protein
LTRAISAVTLATDARVLQDYLHEHIPVSAAMGVRVTSLGPDEVRLTAPLGPNVNHRSAVFGGSCASVAMLAAWCLVHLRVASRDDARVVIQHGDTDYLAPIRGWFTATCRVVDDEDRARFETTLQRRGRARISVDAAVTCGRQVVARFTGAYVAIVGPR